MLDWFLPCEDNGVPEKDIFDAFFAIHSNLLVKIVVFASYSRKLRVKDEQCCACGIS